MILFKFSPLLQAASPSRQTHAFRTLASQPRLTRRETSGLLQLVSGRGARGGWPHYALFGLTKLHREVLRATQRRARAGGRCGADGLLIAGVRKECVFTESNRSSTLICLAERLAENVSGNCKFELSH